mmetsp:Transcript_29226/g.52949  ORF Transcript_29226/g.52949 Transcript_29226/m.52949 type:complete len:138 (+) Transcript_29226:1345-1758(+)
MNDKRLWSSSSYQHLPGGEGVVKEGLVVNGRMIGKQNILCQHGAGEKIPSEVGRHASHRGTASVAAAAAQAHSNVRLKSMGISDPDMLGNALGNSNTNFGISLESLRSSQLQGSDASSWLNQYNSIGNIGSNKNSRE